MSDGQPDSEIEESTIARLAARIEQHLSDAGVTPASLPVPSPEVLSAYPPEIVRAVMETSARAFDAELELRRQRVDLVREQAQLELRRLELDHERVECERKLAEHRIDAHLKLHENATRVAAASLADRQRVGLYLAAFGLITSAILGVFGSAWVGGGVALAALASWLVGQRGAHGSEALLAAVPAPNSPPALPEPAADAEVASRALVPEQ